MRDLYPCCRFPWGVLGVLGAMSGVAVGLRALTCWSDMPFLGRKLLGQKVAYVSFP